MARAATAAAPRALRLLGAALLLLLLVPAGRRAAGAPVVAELRCQCLQTSQGIHPKNIQSVKVTPPAPHCAQTEVIATLKNGQEVCLNPEAPMVKKIINKMLNKVTLKDGTLICLDPEAEWVMIIIKKIINRHHTWVILCICMVTCHSDCIVVLLTDGHTRNIPSYGYREPLVSS
uniref:growth-regulated protein homolog beta-like isoform X3 n=1 Tax=Halichoerus grypus TaxID=9711 RepID=UPI00165A0203|nr:growth-regulated protein homolog beta-like isoform X3 [Halichoerus grypus]